MVDVSPRTRRRAAPARARRTPVEPAVDLPGDDLLGDLENLDDFLTRPIPAVPVVDDLPTECFAAVPAEAPALRHRGHPLLRALVVAMLVSLVAGTATAVAADKAVVVTVDGVDRVVHTFAGDVAGALASAGIVVTPQDRVEPAAGTDLADGDHVIFARARPLTLVEGSSERRIMSASRPPSSGERATAPVRARCSRSSATKSLTIDAVGNGRVDAAPLPAAAARRRSLRASAARRPVPGAGVSSKEMATPRVPGTAAAAAL